MKNTTTIEALFGAIVSALSETFSDRVATIGAYEPWADSSGDESEPIKTPVLLLELESLDQDEDIAPRQTKGRTAIRCSWAVHAILSLSTERLQQALPELAASIMALVRKHETYSYVTQRGNRWGLEIACDYPSSISAQPAAFTPGLNGRDSWVVRWEQVVYLSDDPLSGIE